MAEQDLERVNRIREEFVDAIREIYDDFKGKTGGLSVHEMTESLYRFLVKFRLSQRLSEMEQQFLGKRGSCHSEGNMDRPISTLLTYSTRS